MTALAFIQEHLDVPASKSRTITCDIHTLAAAFQIAYLAGRADEARQDATYAFLRQTIRNMQRSLRRALPVPRAGVEGGLDLMLCAINERLGHTEEV